MKDYVYAAVLHKYNGILDKLDIEKACHLESGPD